MVEDPCEVVVSGMELVSARELVSANEPVSPSERVSAAGLSSSIFIRGPIVDGCARRRDSLPASGMASSGSSTASKSPRANALSKRLPVT